MILPILLGVFLIWYYLKQFSNEDLDKIIHDVKNANYYWILLSLLFGVLSHISRAYRWNFMLEPLGYKPKFINNIMAVLVAYFLNLFVPRSGEVARAAAMDKYENIPFEKGFGTIVAERISDMIMLLIILATVFFLQTDLILSYFKDINPTNKIIFGIVVITVSYLLYRIFKKSTNSFVLKIKNFLNGLVEGVLSILKMKKKIPFILHTIFIWAMYILMFWAVSFTVNETANISFEIILVSFIAGAVAMSISNGGFGFYPVFVAEALAQYGISESSGTSFGLLMWTSQTIMVLLFGGLSLILLPIYNKDKN